MGKKTLPREGRLRRTLVLLLGAAVYAMLYALCSQIDENGVSCMDVTLRRFCMGFPIAACILYVLFHNVFPRMEFRPDTEQNGKPFCIWGAVLLIFLCYIPLFLIEYPGTFSYDSMKQVQQIASGEYSTILPLLHTLMIRLCISFYGILGSLEKCGAIYSLLQMALMSLCFAMICAALSRSVSRRAARIGVAFFCLYPNHMAFASSCTKDGLFSACLTLFMALCFEEAYTGKLTTGWRIIRVLAGVVACLMRSNLLLAFAAWLLVLMLTRKQGGRFLLREGALVFSLALICNALLAGMTHASGGTVKELLSVPAVQMARARLYAGDRLTDRQKEMMDSMFAVNAENMEAFYQTYDPTVADSIKNFLDEDAVRSRWQEYLALWVSVGRVCPDIYLDAFLNLALPSLYPYKTFHVTHRYIETGCGNALTSPFGLPPLSLPERFKPVQQWLDVHLFSTGADDVPVIRWFFNCGVVFWLLGAMVLFAGYRGDGTIVLTMTLLVFYWITHLLGPVMQGRYLYPFLCALPFFMARPQRKSSTEPLRRKNEIKTDEDHDGGSVDERNHL